MIRRWQFSWTVLLIGLVAAGLFTASATYGSAVICLVAGLALSWATSPWFFPLSIPAAEAQRLSAVDGLPIVYWRPGCQFCMRLRFKLGRSARRLHWVDIWSDPAGAAEVRGHTGGDETVPTVIVNGQAHINPDPAWVREQAKATHRLSS